MNTPTIESKRLVLRKFINCDLDAMYRIFKDEECNRYLPWFPLKSKAEAKVFFLEKYESVYQQENGYAYAICMKEDNVPIGYIGVDMCTDAYDLGYGLLKEYWHQGITSEAVSLLIEQVKQDGLPYITATHDKENIYSGKVMEKAGMRYCYSYEELWQPKNYLVTFRLYQLNFLKEDTFVYRKYWEKYANHFIENI